jgi:hypothetical protein
MRQQPIFLQQKPYVGGPMWQILPSRPKFLREAEKIPVTTVKPGTPSMSMDAQLLAEVLKSTVL